jgi:DNA-binding NtrC family response regulator
VVHGIVVDHHGAIAVDSAPGLGSTFHLYLPVATPPPQATTNAPAGAEPFAAQGQRVIYVDDDDVMTLMVERLLTRRGFAVVCYQDAHAAIDAIRADPARCDCVVTDYNMPDASGLDVARMLASIAPSLPVIVSSGYISDELRAGAERFGVRAVMEKENTFDELPGLIGRVLSEAAH